MDAWKLEATGKFTRKFKKYRKQHKPEAIAVLKNVQAFLDALNGGVHPRQFTAGFIHVEPHGVVAIDERGDGVKGRATRLYIYALQTKETVYLITIGDKSTQQRDIKDCKTFLKQLEKGTENE